MPTYELEEKLPSVIVTKDLLRDLEDYILRKGVEITGESNDTVRAGYAVAVVDSSGREMFNSFSEFKFAYYPNDTEQIKVTSQTARMRWEVALSRRQATLSIFLNKEGAREIVRGIQVELLGLFNQYRNSNFLFHKNTFVTLAGVASMAGGAALLGLSEGLTHLNTFTRYLLGVVVLSTSYLAAGYFFKPYSVFQTRRNEKLEAWYKWFVLGVLSFLLFNVGGVYLRKSMLGY